MPPKRNHKKKNKQNIKPTSTSSDLPFIFGQPQTNTGFNSFKGLGDFEHNPFSNIGSSQQQVLKSNKKVEDDDENDEEDEEYLDDELEFIDDFLVGGDGNESAQQVFLQQMFSQMILEEALGGGLGSSSFGIDEEDYDEDEWIDAEDDEDEEEEEKDDKKEENTFDEGEELITSGVKQLQKKILKSKPKSTYLSPDEIQEVITQISLMISMDLSLVENSLYYTMFQNAMKRFYLEVKLESAKKTLEMEMSNIPLHVRKDLMKGLENDEEIRRDCYESQPSLECLRNIVNNEFSGKQDLNIIENKELKRVAKFVINSKKRRKEMFEGDDWNEEMDVNTLNEFEDDEEEFDFDENDAEYKKFLRKQKKALKEGEEDNSLIDLENLNRFKTDGAYLKRLLIGEWSPSLNYDGQYRIKVSPLEKKLYYKFYTFVPKFKPSSIDTKYSTDLVMNSVKDGKEFYYNVMREIDRFKVSHVLMMSIHFDNIIGIHVQSFSHEDRKYSLLVLELNQRPSFYSKRIACFGSRYNKLKERTDFTSERQASRYNRHYIIGDDREIKRIVALILESDDSKRMKEIFKKGMQDIQFPSSTFEYNLEEESARVKQLSLLNRDEEDDEVSYAKPLNLEAEGFINEEDEKEELDKHYDSDLDEFDFVNNETIYVD
ncbi:hypothetical protein ABK040_004361 [Willaertia magna]